MTIFFLATSNTKFRMKLCAKFYCSRFYRSWVEVSALPVSPTWFWLGLCFSLTKLYTIQFSIICTILRTVQRCSLNHFYLTVRLSFLSMSSLLEQFELHVLNISSLNFFLHFYFIWFPAIETGWPKISNLLNLILMMFNHFFFFQIFLTECEYSNSWWNG